MSPVHFSYPVIQLEHAGTLCLCARDQSLHLKSLLLCVGSYASWLAGDNLAPAANAALGTVGGKVPLLKQRASGFAANGGAATLAVQKVADALKVTWHPSAT